MHALDPLFRPRSIAVIGASPVPGNARNRLMRILLKHGYGGRIYPVSPSHAEIEGLRAYASVADLPETPDVALVMTPARTVPGIVEACGLRGIRNAIVFSSGFEESKEGEAIAAELAEAARRFGITLVGPNCQGIWSVREKAMLTFSPAAVDIGQLKHAPIAIVSQSGAIAGAIGGSLHRSGLGCSYVVSVGNETVFDALDALDWLVEQDDVRVVALYIEGLARAHRLMAIAQRARARGVRILVLKAGRSELGQQAAASHTGKIASSYAVYADLLAQAGMVAVDSLRELLVAVEVLAFMDLPRNSAHAGAGVAMVSSSGGAGALLADHSSECSLPLAMFGSETTARLRDMLPDFARRENPIDLTGQVNADTMLFRKALRAVADDPRTEAIVIQHASGGRRWLQEDGAFYKELGRELPVIVSFVGDSLPPETREEYRGVGVLLSPEPSETVNALSLLYRFGRHPAELSAPRPPAPLRAAPRGWEETMQYCLDAGIRPARWTVLQASDRAEAACAQLACPLVVKVLPSDAEHKSERGLVRLRVGRPQDVDAIAAEFRTILGKPEAGILVQEMVGQGAVEAVLSCLRQTDFGPILSIGTGGTAVELYQDITHLALPVTHAQVRAALARLKLHTLLQGFRGQAAADEDALVDAAVCLGDLFLATPELNEFELNPVLVGRRGAGLLAVDALAVA